MPNASTRLRKLSLLAAFALMACEDKSSPNPAPSASAAPAPQTAATNTSAAPSSAPTASSAAPLPSDDPSPAPLASAAPSAAPAAAKADAGASSDAGPKPPRSKDAGAPPSADAGAPSDAGSLAMSDAGAVPAGPGAEIAQKVDAIFLGRKTFSARFKQQYSQKIAGQVKDSTGTVFVEKPNKISFRYDAPNKNRIVSDGTTLKVYVAEDNQMFETPVQKTQYPGALAFLMGNGIGPSFTFTLNDKAKFDGGPVLLGKPVQPTPSYEYVMFYVDQALLAKSDPGVIRRVLIVEAQGNRNRFDFEGASQPASIDPGEFSFTPPPGTNITR
jgi:outer membrane lipoprotein carrier protein